MMNVAASHDAPRLLTDFYNSNKYKYQASPNDNPAYKTGKPDEETYKRLRLYLVHTFTSIGAPHIWNGDEMGMWGADDPHPRKPLMWKEFDFKPERRNNYQLTGSVEKDTIKFNQAHFDFYKKLISIRKNNPVLVTGEIDFIQAEGKTLAYKRHAGNEEIFVLFNAGNVPQKYSFLKTGKYRDLLTNKVVDTKKLSVNSLSAMVLKRIK
jgi:glycosidase